jgi:hypothetical protein
MKQEQENNLNETIPKMVEGHFKIEKFDLEGNLLEEYEDKNKVVIHVYKYFLWSVYANWSVNVDHFRIHAFALGTDGVNQNGTLKGIDKNRNRLYSEANFWDGRLEPQDKAYVYQMTFNKPDTTGTHYAFKTSEGTTFPHNNGVPINYRGTPYNDEDEIEGSLTMRRNMDSNTMTIHQEIYLGKLAGNGHPAWTSPPEYSEAALYMPQGMTTSGSSLGTMFSMKTFPAMAKTEDCVIKITWDLSFIID